MEILNKLVRELIPFAHSKKFDLICILKTIDIVLCNSELNLNNTDEVNAFVDTFIALNTLFVMFNINTDWPESHTKVFDNESLEKCKDKVTSIPRFKMRRLDGYKEFDFEFFDEISKFVDSLR